MTTADYAEKIPNNVELHEDRRLQRALESWQPNFLQLVGVDGPDAADRGRLPAHRGQRRPRGLGPLRPRARCSDYRWGIFLAEREHDRRIALRRAQGRAGLAEGARRVPRGPAAADRHPGRHRAGLASSSSATSAPPRPSLYDLRNLFQVNVEEGRHLWAMVYLLHAYFGREGREEAEELLHRNSGSEDVAAHPRRVQRGDAGLAVVLHVHLLHRPGRQVPARHAEGDRLRPAVAHLRVHAQGGGAPHVRRHHRHRPGGRAHRAAHGRARHRRRRPARRHPAAT